jgi:hypothetical protein
MMGNEESLGDGGLRGNLTTDCIDFSAWSGGGRMREER